MIAPAGFLEVRACHDLFVLRHDALCDLMVLHVDDARWVGEGEAYSKVQDFIRAHLELKHAKVGDVEFLGRVIEQGPASFAVRTPPDETMSEVERSQLRNPVCEMVWQVRGTLPTGASQAPH